MPEGIGYGPNAKKSPALKPSKGQSDALASINQTGQPLGALLDFVRKIAGAGGPQMPAGQPMGQLAVPMPQVPMPQSPVIPGMPQIPGMPGPSGGAGVLGFLQNIMANKQPSAEQTAQGQPQQPAQQSTAGGDKDGMLGGLLKLLAAIGGK